MDAELCPCEIDLPTDKYKLYHLICRGAVDPSNYDKPWDALTRSMCYAVAIGDWLWVLLQSEEDQVKLLSSNLIFLLICFRVIIWNLANCKNRHWLDELEVGGGIDGW